MVYYLVKRRDKFTFKTYKEYRVTVGRILVKIIMNIN
jgi:hypothetical protein